jgi:hypothetical protein
MQPSNMQIEKTLMALFELNRFADLVPCYLSDRAFLFVEPLPSQVSGQGSYQVVTG